MTVTYQISDKRGDAILLVKAEGQPGDELYSSFAAAVQDAGLDSSLNAFGTALVQAVSNAQPLVQQARYAPNPNPEPWGNPPVPQMPAAAAPIAAPAPVGRSCQHGAMSYKSGNTNGRDWAFWGCNAKSNDPTKCEKVWA